VRNNIFAASFWSGAGLILQLLQPAHGHIAPFPISKHTLPSVPPLPPGAAKAATLPMRLKHIGPVSSEVAAET